MSDVYHAMEVSSIHVLIVNVSASVRVVKPLPHSPYWASARCVLTIMLLTVISSFWSYPSKNNMYTSVYHKCM